MLPIWLTDTVTPDLDRALHYTHLWGLEGLELRSMGRVGDRVPNVNEAKLKRRLAEHDLTVEAVVPGVFEGDADERATWMNEIAALAETFGFCRRIGCTRVVVSGFSQGSPEAAWEALRRAGAGAARAGCTLVVLNEAGMLHPTGRDLAGLLDGVDHPQVQAAWDPATAVQAGEEAHQGLAALEGQVGFVRCWDGDQVGDDWIAAPLGEGSVGWDRQLRMLRQQGYDGPVSLGIYLPPPPKHGLRDATRLIRLVRESA